MNDDDDQLRLSARSRALIDGLAPAERAHLKALIAHAAEDHRRLLEQALNDAARMVPAPFRKRVQKMFLG